jgi:hypothetical protein
MTVRLELNRIDMRSFDSSDALACANKNAIELREEKAIVAKFEFTGALRKLRTVRLVACSR